MTNLERAIGGIATNEQVIHEETVVIPSFHNVLRIQARNNNWVSVWSNTQEICSEQNPNADVCFVLDPGTYVVRTDGIIEKMSSYELEGCDILLEQLVLNKPACVRLTSDAPDQHLVDGVGEIPADGKSLCNIKIEKIAPDGTPLTREEDNDRLYIRTTGGTVLDADKDHYIRCLELVSGTGNFRLQSENTPKVVTVSVFSGGSPPVTAEIQVEFVHHRPE